MDCESARRLEEGHRTPRRGQHGRGCVGWLLGESFRRYETGLDPGHASRDRHCPAARFRSYPSAHSQDSHRASFAKRTGHRRPPPPPVRSSSFKRDPHSRPPRSGHCLSYGREVALHAVAHCLNRGIHRRSLFSVLVLRAGSARAS